MNILVHSYATHFPGSQATREVVLSFSDGDSVRLECRTGSGPVVWYVENIPISSASGKITGSFRHKFSSERNDSGAFFLLISGVTPRQEGVYRCVDESGFGSDVVRYRLNVTRPGRRANLPWPKTSNGRSIIESTPLWMLLPLL